MGFQELLDALRGLDEVTLVELLELTSDQIVDAFLDDIHDQQERLTNAIDDEL